MANLPTSQQIGALARRDARLEIAWGDGHVNRYPTIRLLEACRRARCGDTGTAVRHERLTGKPARPEPIEVGEVELVLAID